MTEEEMAATTEALLVVAGLLPIPTKEMVEAFEQAAETLRKKRTTAVETAELELLFAQS